MRLLPSSYIGVPALWSRVLAILALAVAATFVASVAGPAATAVLWQRIQWILSAALAGAIVLARLPGATGRLQTVRTAAAIALGIWLLAQITAALALLAPALTLPSEVLFGAAVVPGIVAVSRATSSRVTPAEALAVRVDSLTVFAAITTLMIWLVADTAPVRGNPALVVLPTLYFATAGSSLISSLVVRARMPSYLVLTGLVAMGSGWFVAPPVGAADTARGIAGAIFPLGVAMLGVGCAVWTDRGSDHFRYVRAARRLRQAVPLVAVLVALVPMLVEHNATLESVMEPAIATTVLLAILRQSLLIVRQDKLSALERAARDSEREASQRLVDQLILAREVANERAALANRLAEIDASASSEAAGSAVCDVVRATFGFAAVGLAARNGHGPAALARCGEAPTLVDEAALDAPALPGGWWLGDVGHPAMRLLTMRLMGTAGEEVVLWARPSGQLDDEHLRSRESVWRESAAIAGAMLAPLLAVRRRRLESRDRIREIVERGAFSPVFQPIVELADGHVVGYEALTRFTDGTRPDLRFAEAAEAGVELALERACLRAQVEAARVLPAGHWLSVNVSPASILALTPMVSALEGIERDIVLEVTEHAAIEDYDELRGRIASLGDRVRISVDDAGSGYASLRHVLELRPAFVKLDISIVRSIDADPARSGIVAGLVHFARETGCELVAEGVETDGERRRLLELGVCLAQGYLFGRPASAALIAQRSLAA